MIIKIVKNVIYVINHFYILIEIKHILIKKNHIFNQCKKYMIMIILLVNIVVVHIQNVILNIKTMAGGKR